jgi:hypothetical protein
VGSSKKARIAGAVAVVIAFPPSGKGVDAYISTTYYKRKLKDDVDAG